MVSLRGRSFPAQRGRIVFTRFRGPDNAAVLQYDPNHPDGMDSLNSFGNFETIPPYTNGSKHRPLGRIIRGGREDTILYYPDKSVDRLVNAQGLQNVLYVDTSWLLVGHVDETLMFQKAATRVAGSYSSPIRHSGRLCFRMQATKDMARSISSSAKCGATAHRWKTTIDGVLGNTDVLTASANAAAKIATQVAAIKAETGLTDTESSPCPSCSKRTRTLRLHTRLIP